MSQSTPDGPEQPFTPPGDDPAPTPAPFSPADPGYPGHAPQSYPPPPGYAQPPGPQPQRRSVGMLVAGIILLVIGGFAVLGQLVSISMGNLSGPIDAPTLLGYLIGALLCLVLPIGLGIFLIVKSSRR